MHREIETHKVEGDLPQNQLRIMVVDEPGAGGANHAYVVSGFNSASNPSGPVIPYERTPILFQNGPIKEAGLNGVTQEALLAIVIDRLEAFQKGPYPSKDSESALRFCQTALVCLQNRTRERLARGVEGTLAK